MQNKNNKFQEIPGINDPNLKEFKKLLEPYEFDGDLIAEITDQFKAGINGEIPNLIFFFTEGEYVVTGIHVPETALDGVRGPILIQGSNPRHIIAAFSQDEIRNKINQVDWQEQVAGLPGISDAAWINELEKLVELAKIEIQENPPVDWAGKLGI